MMGGLTGYDGEWKFIDTINVKDKISKTQPLFRMHR